MYASMWRKGKDTKNREREEKIGKGKDTPCDCYKEFIYVSICYKEFIYVKGKTQGELIQQTYMLENTFVFI